MAPVCAALIDIDGVLTVSWRPIPGAVAAVTRLRELGIAVALLTNTITGVLVKTGKYLPEAVAAADGVPDHILDSIADVPALIETHPA